ncbi:MAG: 4Fe-4S dicluster domain-containing protein [Deltaproteobacteria bacterium]|nr:4Fe-4S dicluster domain-containing protein [Deltaproteobacteria bacterium]
MSDGATAPARADDSFVPAGPRCLDGRCTRVRWSHATCDRCRAACPAEALALDPGPVPLLSRCSGCGACVAACPSDALRLAEFDPAAFGRGLATAPDLAPVIACGATDFPTPYRVPCLARLGPGTWLEAAALGVARFVLQSGTCLGCDRRVAMTRFAATLELTVTLGKLAGHELRFDWRCARSGATPVDRERRGFLRRFFATPHAVSREICRPVPPATVLPAAPEAPRRALLALLRSGGGVAARRIAPAVEWPFGRVDIDPARCHGCPVCAAVCPTGAIRRAADASRSGDLLLDQDLCTACGACAAACRAEAARVRAALPWELLNPPVVARVRPGGRTCRTCGRPIAPAGPDVCESCVAPVYHLATRLRSSGVPAR